MSIDIYTLEIENGEGVVKSDKHGTEKIKEHLERVAKEDSEIYNKKVKK